MNNESPLIPQGSLPEQKNKGRARVKIAVLFVLAVHGVGLLALLMQGCRRDEGTTANAQPTNTVATPDLPLPPAPDTNIITKTEQPTNVGPGPGTVEPVPAGATDYKITKGDTFGSLAKKFNVTSKAIADANPTVDPLKLQINQNIHIPAPTPKAPAPTPSATAHVEAGPGEQIYVVKSGDNLSKIGQQFGTSAKAIYALNNLKTTALKVGEKLRIPVKTATNTAPVEHAATNPTAAGTVPVVR